MMQRYSIRKQYIEKTLSLVKRDYAVSYYNSSYLYKEWLSYRNRLYMYLSMTFSLFKYKKNENLLDWLQKLRKAYKMTYGQSYEPSFARKPSIENTNPCMRRLTVCRLAATWGPWVRLGCGGSFSSLWSFKNRPRGSASAAN